MMQHLLRKNVPCCLVIIPWIQTGVVLIIVDRLLDLVHMLTVRDRILFPCMFLKNISKIGIPKPLVRRP